MPLSAHRQTWSTRAYLRLLWRFAALLACMGGVTLWGSGYLLQNTLHKAQAEVFRERFQFTAQRTVSVAEHALALRMPLAPGTPLAQGLAHEVALEPLLQAITLENAQHKPLLYLAGRAPPAGPGNDGAQLLEPVRNDLGHTTAWVRLTYHTGALHAAQARVHNHLQQALAWALALFVLVLGTLCALLAWWLRRPTPAWPLPGGAHSLLGSASALALALALAVMGWQAHTAGQEAITPDQNAKALALARSSAALIARALQAQVPLDALVGLDEHARALHQKNPEIAALALRTPQGHTLSEHLFAPPSATAPTVRAPVLHAGIPVAEVVLTLDTGVLARQLQALLLDMTFLGAVCLLLALEWVALGHGTRSARALLAWHTRRARRLTHSPPPARDTPAALAVRPALFLFMLAEECTRPFLPTWARSLAPPGSEWSPSLLAGLPLVAFLALVALLQWPLALASERWGRKPGLIAGALVGSAAFAWAALWPGYYALVGARLVGALGFALVFVSAQGAVLDACDTHNRSRSLAQFVRAILVAGLCGPPLGGLVAERWGVPAAFALAGAVALLAAFVAWRHMPRSAPGLAVRAPPAQPAPWRDQGLWALLLGCALPAKLLLAALCFYLLPLQVQDMGYGSAVTGRLQTIYPLTLVLLVPLAARLADQSGRRSAWVLGGSLVAGGSALAAWPLGGGVWALAWVLLGLGLGQALSITPQSALVAERAPQSAAALGLFRLTERSGSALGPVLGALLLPLWGFSPAVALLGALTLLGSAVYGWSLRARRTGKTPRAANLG